MKCISKLLLLASFVLIVGPTLKAADARPDLAGKISEADGTPIAGASVFIYTAGPKLGTSSFCPSCYADCQKKAQTDAEGDFKIESLDPSLLFRLLVVAGGHESQFVSKVDPAKGEQKIKMKPLSEAALKSDLRIKGMVINEHGKPVPGATISPEGVGLGQITQWGGNDEVIEPLAVADEQGRFVLFCKTNSIDTVSAMVDGRGVAQQWVMLKPGGDYLLRLQDGVSLTGQVLRDGKPVQGVSIAATTTDRTCGVYFNCNPVATDSNGRFLLLNVPPHREFAVFTTMDSLHGAGALPDKIVTTAASGVAQDLGKLEIQPAFTLAGRVVLSDGKAVPANTRMFLGREKASDSQQITLDSEGRFEFKGVPAESVSLAVRIKGYRLSKRNPSLDWLNGRILGRVTSDVNDLTILLELGDWEFNRTDDRPGGDDDYPVNKPLRSLKL
jgi:hypothetical protein